VPGNPTADARFAREDARAIARRRWAWLAVPTLVGGGLGLALALCLPPVYQAESVLGVRPQSEAPAELEALFAQAELLVTARDGLAPLIAELGLYPELAARPLEERVAALRADLSIEAFASAERVESLRVAYRSSNGAAAAQVANRLADDFRARARSLAPDAAEPLHMVQSAAAPSAPVGPDPARYAGGGAALGALLGLCAAVLLELADPSIRSVSQLQRLLDVPVLAAIPEARNAGADAGRARVKGAARV
jgi:polysaccharide biosynthesis transport protein